MRNPSSIVLSLLIAAGAANLTAAEFLPLAPGNNWTYRDATTGHSFNIRVGTQFYINGKVYHSLDGYADTKLLVRTNEYGNIVYLDEENNTEPILISFEPLQRGWWEGYHRQCPTMGQTQEKRGTHEGPGGRWSDVLEMVYRSHTCADAGPNSEQFAENIGMLRRVDNTIAGPRTYDLVYARVGTQTISATRTGTFRLTAANGTEPGTWQATLRVELPESIRLRFPSSQEYEVRLRDASGAIVWTWSADKLFLQQVQDRLIPNGWNATVTVPHPPTPATIVTEPFRYTLEAWLTTAEGEPKLGAVTNVQLP